LLLLYHAHAANGDLAVRLQQLLARWPAMCSRATVLAIRSVDDARRAIDKAPEACVVAAGGDGTVNLVACALLHGGRGEADRPPTLGILPLGTGNALATAFGLVRVRDAVRALTGDTFATLDVMRTSLPAAPVALVSISVGFESSFVARYSRHRTRWTRLGAGVTAVMASGARRWRARLVADDCVLSDGSATIHNAGLYNTPCYGFGVRPWPDADPRDGKAEAIVVTRAARYWRCLTAGLRTAVPCDGIDPAWTQWQRASFSSDTPFQIDGDLVAGDEMSIRVQPAALRLMVPAPHR
jgi:diacylglycerol kinase family enzyme